MVKALGGYNKLSGELDKGKEMTFSYRRVTSVPAVVVLIFYQGSADSRSVYLPVGYSGEQLGLPHSLVRH